MLYLAREKNPGMQILLGIPFYYPVDTLQRFSNTQIDAAEKSFILGIRKTTQIRVEEKLADIHLRQEAVRNLAKEFCAHLLDFPDVFATAEKRAPLHHWIWDGVHPTIAGHFLMYQKWLEVCRENGLLA